VFPGSVLVVEDDPALHEVMRMLLGDEMHLVVGHAATAEAGLDLLAKVLPSVVLLDLLLPGTDGFEFLRRVREQPPPRAPPVVAMSVGRAEEMRPRALAAGATAFWPIRSSSTSWPRRWRRGCRPGPGRPAPLDRREAPAGEPTAATPCLGGKPGLLLHAVPRAAPTPRRLARPVEDALW
jgi:CheY-like chemotaxis protein